MRHLRTHLREICAEDQVIAASSPMGVGQLRLESSVAALVRRFCHGFAILLFVVHFYLEWI
jgi:hypothetical protein